MKSKRPQAHVTVAKRWSYERYFRGAPPAANPVGRDVYIPDAPWDESGIFTDPWMVEFYGFHVGKYTSPMECAYMFFIV